MRLVSIALALTFAGCGASQPQPQPQAPEQAAETVEPLPRSVDRCPNLFEDYDGFDDDDGCPDIDDDGDGIVDTDDQCPCDAEDRDGFEDEDGCPDWDNDGDHIYDACDQCPNRAESWNGIDDDDGCGEVVISNAMIQVLSYVRFTRRSARPLHESIAVIDAVADILKANTYLLRIEVEGHASTDERRPERLAERRAEAVIDALVARGVDRSRLVPRTYGATRPIDSQRLEANRRVMFNILESAPRQPTPAPSPTDLRPEEVICPGSTFTIPDPACVRP